MRCKELINDDKGGGCLSGHWGRFRLARLLICLTVLCCREGYALFASDVLGEYSAILRYRLNLRHFSELGGLDASFFCFRSFEHFSQNGAESGEILYICGWRWLGCCIRLTSGLLVMELGGAPGRMFIGACDWWG